VHQFNLLIDSPRQEIARAQFTAIVQAISMM
jgi:hypothetical protein